MNLSCSCVPQRTSSPRYGIAPEARDERQQQQLLHEAHRRMRRHLERAELDEPEPPCRPVGRVELVDAELGAMRVAGHVDQEIAEQPIDEPRRRLRRLLHLRERELELVERVVPRLVDSRRLARRPDEHAREEVRQRRVIAAKTRSGSGAGRAGGGTGCRPRVAPPSTTWLPPPVPVCRPSSMNFSVTSRV